MRVGIIANQRAGAPGSMRILGHVERFARSWATEVHTVVPRPDDRIERVSAELARTVDLIMVVGGDGTLNGVVNGIMHAGTHTPIAFVPAGRGKDVARTLGGIRWADLQRRSATWKHRAVDVGFVATDEGSGRYFLNASTSGLGARSARVASRLPRLPGTTCYLLGAGVGLMQDRPYTARLCLDGREIVLHECRLVVVANCRFLGGGLRFAPDAAVDDGLLDVVGVAGIGRVEILNAIPRVFRGTHLTHHAVQSWRAAEITIRADIPVEVETDGELIGTTPVTYSVARKALTWAVLA